MENEILEILKQIQKEQVKTSERLERLEEGQKNLTEGQKKLEEGQKKLEEGQERIEKKLDSVHEQTADLTEFRTETKESIDNLRKDINAVINVTKTNCYDITYLKSAK
ncbi:hypothetical protein [Clostridium hydrogenum]|uniref:hypothetical protein n=1 Tax=Clostridium hydrogenum TaxID=2855764 RepID=UPI001F422B65|nr:hypothetical protein [Clostridium hydrogenum]